MAFGIFIDLSGNVFCINSTTKEITKLYDTLFQTHIRKQQLHHKITFDKIDPPRAHSLRQE